MPEYVLTKGSIGGLVLDDGRSVDVEKGDKVELSEEKAKRFRWLKLIGRPQPIEQSAPIPTPPIDVDWSKYRDMRAPDLIAEIRDTDSLDDLMELKKVEEGEGGQNRIGVLKEIDKRVKQLEGGGE